MYVFRKIWCALIFCYLRFEISPFALLTLSRRRPLSYRNQSIDLLCKLMDWYLFENGPCHERFNNELRASKITDISGVIVRLR